MNLAGTEYWQLRTMILACRSTRVPVDPDPVPEVTVPERPPVATPPGSAYGAAEAATAMDRRRQELEHLAGITDVLTDVERRADELNRRAAELLEDWP